MTAFVSTLVVLFAPAGTSPCRADIYATIAEANGNVDRLDVTTGTHTVLANNGNVYGGLAYNANQTVLYGVEGPYVGANTTLVTINQTTGAQTVVGANGWR